MLKLWAFLLASLSTAACVKTADVVVPEDEATAEQRVLISDYTSEIQMGFHDIGVEVNLNQLPIVITSTMGKPEYAGECYRDSHIRIRKSYLEQLMQNIDANSMALWVLLTHEFGHCYFGLDHYKKALAAPEGFQFRTVEEWYVNGKLYEFDNFYENYSGTVMDLSVAYFSRAQSVKLFYLKELAGQVDGSSLTDFLAQDGIELVEKL